MLLLIRFIRKLITEKNHNLLSPGFLNKILKGQQIKFPGLDFYLIAINYAEENAPQLTPSERVIPFTIRKSHKAEDYRNMILYLVNEHYYDH